MWEEDLTERERLWRVLETLDDPATVSEIAAEADAALDSAEDELERMICEGRVQQHEVNDEVKYTPSFVWMLFGEIRELINDHSREKLESQLVDYQSQIESLQADYNVRSSAELRRRLIGKNITAAEMQEIQDTASRWDSLEDECRLIRHALHLYEDVTHLSVSADDPTFPL